MYKVSRVCYTVGAKVIECEDRCIDANDQILTGGAVDDKLEVDSILSGCGIPRLSNNAGRRTTT